MHWTSQGKYLFLEVITLIRMRIGVRNEGAPSVTGVEITKFQDGSDPACMYSGFAVPLAAKVVTKKKADQNVWLRGDGSVSKPKG